MASDAGKDAIWPRAAEFLCHAGCGFRLLTRDFRIAMKFPSKRFDFA